MWDFDEEVVICQFHRRINWRKVCSGLGVAVAMCEFHRWTNLKKVWFWWWESCGMFN